MSKATHDKADNKALIGIEKTAKEIYDVSLKGQKPQL